MLALTVTNGDNLCLKSSKPSDAIYVACILLLRSMGLNNIAKDLVTT